MWSRFGTKAVVGMERNAAISKWGLIHPTPRRVLKSLSTSRLFSSSSEGSPPPNNRGKFLIGMGWGLLGLVLIDQALQYRQEQELKEHYKLLQAMQEEADDQNQANWDKSLPTLFRCKIIRTEPSLDGTKMLRHVSPGDVVDVMEAEIGPNQAYHLCCVPNRKGAIGWYPKEFLERVN